MKAERFLVLPSALIGSERGAVAPACSAKQGRLAALVATRGVGLGDLVDDIVPSLGFAADASQDLLEQPRGPRVVLEAGLKLQLQVADGRPCRTVGL